MAFEQGSCTQYYVFVVCLHCRMYQYSLLFIAKYDSVVWIHTLAFAYPVSSAISVFVLLATCQVPTYSLLKAHVGDHFPNSHALHLSIIIVLFTLYHNPCVSLLPNALVNSGFPRHRERTLFIFGFVGPAKFDQL